MVTLNIDGRTICVPEGTTILDAALSAGIHIPHLCYLKGINEIGACRLCCVEVEGEDKLIPACNNVVAEGMAIHTNNARVRLARRTNLQLILSRHDSKCALCVRSGNCELQTLSNDLGLVSNPFRENLPAEKLRRWDRTFPLIRDTTKCIECMRCIQICDKVQSLNVWDLVATGSHTRVNVSENRTIREADCSLCGQCITHCPVGALRERDDVQAVLRAIEDPETVTVVQIAPAVRTAWGEAFGLEPEQATVNRLAGALRQVGFDYVFDTSYSADLTIMEESAEFLDRLGKGELEQYPMFTSCCPGWVRFVKSQFPQLVGQLSTAKSPQQMFGAVVKNWFARRIGVAPEKICCVSVMPCVAKKAECDLPTMRNAEGVPDVDYVLTTREVVRLLRSEHVPVASVLEAPFDRLLGDYTGAGVIFGATGGVMEAALRTAYYRVTGTNPRPDAFRSVREARRGDARAWREAEFDIAGSTVRVAVASGLGNARALCEAIVKGEVQVQFVEIMACPGGCAGGGGQPIHCDDVERAHERGQVLYGLDRASAVRFSHENADVLALYREELGEPLSEESETWLHTDHFAWQMPGGPGSEQAL